MKYLILTLALTLTALIAPHASVTGNLRLDQVQTVSSKTYPAGTSQNRAWFVEMVPSR